MSRIALIALAGLVTCGTALATDTPRVDQRQANQERRIEQGKASGELTNREAARMERAQDRLEANEEKAKADGVVTAGERAKLRTEARRNSKRIAKQKHDAQDKN